jgi:hypothetical protein
MRPTLPSAGSRDFSDISRYGNDSSAGRSAGEDRRARAPENPCFFGQFPNLPSSLLLNGKKGKNFAPFLICDCYYRKF